MNCNPEFIYLDGFSGYGGFHLGLEQAGFVFDKVYFSEIDKHAIANYLYNFPKSIYAGSITDISRGTIKHLDLFTFGWPCQDNSIAGKRKGQREGTRSGLLYEAVRIINEFKPRNFIAENVKGLLSVNEGIDIIESLKLLSYLNESCPQYDIEMQLLNTRWFLPQNRERLFFIGHLRGSGSRQILPIGEDDTMVTKTSSEKGDKNKIASTLRSANYKINLSADFICVAMRGREYGQQLEESKGDYTNTITSVGKDNLVITHYGHKDKDAKFSEIAPTLKAQSHGHEPMTNDMHGIRRLTPIECERLQGLPDNWTRYGLYNGVEKEISDTQRYKMVGNGVSIPVIKAIGEKLKSKNQL